MFVKYLHRIHSYLESSQVWCNYYIIIVSFFSMMKMLYWMCKEADCSPNSVQISHVVLRNFSGYEGFGFDPLRIFWESCRSCHVQPRVADFENEEKEKAIEKWRVKLRIRFEEDNIECVRKLKSKFFQLSTKGSSNEDDQLAYRFSKHLKSGIFPHPEVQEEYDKVFEVYFKETFELKVRIIL